MIDLLSRQPCTNSAATHPENSLITTPERREHRKKAIRMESINMSARTILLSVGLMVAVSACLSNRQQIEQLSADQVAAQTAATTDRFSSSVKFVAPEISDGLVNYFLRGWKHKDGRFTHQLYVHIAYGEGLRPKNSGRGWIFYSKATTEGGGQTINVTSIDREVKDCRRGNQGNRI